MMLTRRIRCEQNMGFASRRCLWRGIVKISRNSRDAIDSKLLPRESVLLTARLRVPKVATQGVTFFTVAMFVRLFDEIRNIAKLRELKRQSIELNFPLDRNMIVCITDHRILLWNLPMFHRAIRYLGDVPRQRIRSASLPYVSEGKWKFVKIQTVDGASIQLLVDGQTALALSQMLSPAK